PAPAAARAVTDGLAVVDKPAGMTSHDVVGRCRRIFAQRRVGHAGTLDPDATGVLLVGLGPATRLLRFLSALTKTYTGQVVLGRATSTGDASGEVVGSWDMSGVTLEQAREAALGLTGEIDQVPPMVSALKVGGRRLHHLARAGLEVERKPRRVLVSRFELFATEEPGVFDLEVVCGSGTYVRALAADLGAALGGGAYLRGLRRTSVGSFDLGQARQVDQLDASCVLAPAEALRDYPSVRVGEELRRMVLNGTVLDKAALGVAGEGPWPVLDEQGDLLGVYEASSLGRAKPAVVLAPAAG
ncbi:MAG TPA: tRNA pseudouridine(55) synthase TruB, partial [Acidimicrobiales bacterium]|nr:tRNA pseudouridine(55) synthase TruB [Acidimicrobiales bacterium]